MGYFSGMSWNEMFAPLRMKMDVQRFKSQQQESQVRREAEIARVIDSRNNQLLGDLWKAASDPGMPREWFSHFQTLAKGFASMMNPQQQAALSATVARGLFSKTQAKTEEFMRIKGRRPNDLVMEGSFQEDVSQQMALIGNKVNQAEWDWGLKAFQAGGADKIPLEHQPKMVPVTSFEDKEGEMHQIYGYRDMATGQIKSFDTQTDAAVGLLGPALKDGWSMSMATTHDFVPMKGEVGGHMVTTGGEQYKMMTGVSLTTGQFKKIKIPMGKKDDPSGGAGAGSGKNRLQLDARTQDVLDEMNLGSLGSLSKGDMKTTAATWHDAIQRISEYDLSEKDFNDMGLPNVNSEVGQELLGLQAEGVRRHRALFVPRFRTIDQFWPFDSYEAQDSFWTAIPCDGAMPLIVDGKRQDFWYAKDLQGVEGQHHWFDMYGRKITGFDGFEPGTPVKNPVMPKPSVSKPGLTQAKENLDKKVKKTNPLTLRNVLKDAFTKQPSMSDKMSVVSSYMEGRVGDNMTGEDVMKLYKDLREYDKQLGNFVWKHVLYPVFGAPVDVLLDMEVGDSKW